MTVLLFAKAPAAPPPPPPTAYPPTAKIEIAFTTDPLDAAPAYVDVTSDDRAFEFKRGRPHELGQVDGATGSTLLDNNQRKYDPTNTSSPHSPNLLPLRKTRISLNVDTTVYPQFTSHIEDWPLPWEGPGYYQDVSPGLVDSFEFLGIERLQTIHATMTTNFGPDQDLTYTAQGGGIAGNSISVMYVFKPQGTGPWPTGVAFAEQDETTADLGVGLDFNLGFGGTTGRVKVPALLLLVVLGRNGAALTGTASDVAAAVNSHAVASKYLTASIPDGQDGGDVIQPNWIAGHGGDIIVMPRTFLTGGTYEQELSGTRINHVLDDVGFSNSDRNIDPGASQVAAASFDLKDEKSGLSHIQEIAASELGYFFIAADGRATFHDRNHRGSHRPVLATFGDSGIELTYDQINYSYDRSEIRNSITVEYGSNAEATAEDATSIDSYGRRPYRISTALVDTNEAQAVADYLLYRYKDPHLRVDGISLYPLARQTLWDAILPREIGDRINVKRRPSSGGPTIDLDCFIEQISVNGGIQSDYKIEWQLSPANLDAWALFDDTSYGLFDTDKFGI